MTVPASKIFVSPANAEEFGIKLGELLSPVCKDVREGAFVMSGPVTIGKVGGVCGSTGTAALHL